MVPSAAGSPSDYADLAEVVLAVAREIRLRENDARDAVALTPSNAQVMRYIDAHPGATPSEAAEATGLFRSNLSTAVRELEQLGFLERRPDEQDGRGSRLYSTPSAASNLAVIRDQWAAEVARALGSSDGVTEATALLSQVLEGLAAGRRHSGLRARRGQL